MTRTEYGTAFEYRLTGTAPIHTISYYGDGHAEQAIAKQQELKTKTDYHAFRPIFREVTE